MAHLLPAVRPHLESRGAGRALFTPLTSRALSGDKAAVMGKPRRGGAEGVSPFCSTVPPLQASLRDTYSRAGGALSSSFSIFASSTLWEESEK